MCHFYGIVRNVDFDNRAVGFVYTCAKDVLGFVKQQSAIFDVFFDAEFGITIVLYSLLVQ